MTPGRDERRRHLRNSVVSAILLAGLLAAWALLDRRPAPPAPAAPPPVAVAPAPSQAVSIQPPGEFVGPPRPPCPPPEMAEAPPPLAAADSGFVIQTGVFNDYPNAERLKSRLERAGLPARIETRVHAGPFADRGSAREAQARLDAIGLKGGLLIPPRR